MTPETDALSVLAWSGYQEVRVDHAARTIGRLLAAGQRQATTRRWSERELVDALRRQSVKFVPAGEDLIAALKRRNADWDWGQTTVQRVSDMAVDVLKRAVWLAPIGSTARAAVVECRKSLWEALASIREDRRTLDAYWRAAPAWNKNPIPERGGVPAAPADNTPDLERWLQEVLDDWDRASEPASDPAVALGHRRERLYGQAKQLASSLLSCAPAIHDIVASGNPAIDPGGLEREQLARLHDYLFAAPQQTPVDEAAEPTDGTVEHVTGLVDMDVLERMLRLDVVQLAFSGATQEVEQEVELVQVSCPDRRLLTGVQTHHFGAFYRRPWTVNDWLQGRMNGAEQLLRILLSPERLRQRGWTSLSAGSGVGPADQLKQGPERATALLEKIHRIAVPDDHPNQDSLERWWEAGRADCLKELEQVVGPGRTPPALDACARALARPIQLQILREDLPALATAIRAEGQDSPAGSRMWIDQYDKANKTSADELWKLWQAAGDVGRQRIAEDVGSDTFARTAAHGATVAASTLGSPAAAKGNGLAPAAAVTRVLAAFRGYTLIVWAMVTFLSRGSHFGLHAVELALAAGGVLLAITLLVPGVPLALTLAGVLLLLAGLTAAALRTPNGGRSVGRRLLLPAVVVLIALALLIYRDIVSNGWSHAVTWTLLIKAGVGLLVALLGLWVARAADAAPSKSAGRPRGRAIWIKRDILAQAATASQVAQVSRAEMVNQLVGEALEARKLAYLPLSVPPAKAPPSGGRSGWRLFGRQRRR